MPVRKYRSVADMGHPAWYQPGDAALLRAIDATWTLARMAAPRRFPAGVERFRSFDDMRRFQEERDAEYVRELAWSRQRSEP